MSNRNYLEIAKIACTRYENEKQDLDLAQAHIWAQIAIAEQLKRIADTLENADAPVHHLADDGLDEWRNYDPPVQKGPDLDDVVGAWKDPMEPNYRALADEDPGGDDRDSAEAPSIQ